MITLNHWGCRGWGEKYLIRRNKMVGLLRLLLLHHPISGILCHTADVTYAPPMWIFVKKLWKHWPHYLCDLWHWAIVCLSQKLKWPTSFTRPNNAEVLFCTPRVGEPVIWNSFVNQTCLQIAWKPNTYFPVNTKARLVGIVLLWPWYWTNGFHHCWSSLIMDINGIWGFLRASSAHWFSCWPPGVLTTKMSAKAWCREQGGSVIIDTQLPALG